VSFTVNGRGHHMRYYLTDSMYPSWLVFMKGVHVPQPEKHRFFSMKYIGEERYGVCFQSTKEEV
jgi:hypothetical protein